MAHKGAGGTSAHAEGSYVADRKTCYACNGSRMVRDPRARCSGEHGISTTCEEFGCYEVYIRCMHCDGKGYVIT